MGGPLPTFLQNPNGLPSKVQQGLQTMPAAAPRIGSHRHRGQITSPRELGSLTSLLLPTCLSLHPRWPSGPPRVGVAHVSPFEHFCAACGAHGAFGFGGSFAEVCQASTPIRSTRPRWRSVGSTARRPIYRAEGGGGGHAAGMRQAARAARQGHDKQELSCPSALV
jgi:hypothetical protein